MKKNDLSGLDFNVVPKSANERKTYRMSFQTSTEIIKMIEDAVESKGTRGALKDTLSSWLTFFDICLEGKAIEEMKRFLNGSSDKGLKEVASELKSDEEEGIKANALFMILSFNFKNRSDISALLNFKDKVNKTYTLTHEAKSALISTAKKLSIKNSDVFNLAVTTFCKHVFESKEKKAKEVEAQANAVWPLIDSFSDAADEVLSKLSEIHSKNHEIFDTETSITDLAYESLDTDSVIEKAIGQFVLAIYEIKDVAGIVNKEINK